MRHPLRISIANVFTLLLVVMMPLALQAQDASESENATSNAAVQIAIYPKGGEDGGRFETTVNPGESADMVASIGNLGSDPIELRTYVSGIKPVANGGLKMNDSEAELDGSALWVTYPTEVLTLDAGQMSERTISIAVPDETPAGQYVAAVALETVNPINEGETGAFRQFFRKVVAIYITVPGDIQANFEFGTPEVLVSDGLAGMQIPVTNSGNIRVDLIGNVKVTDNSGNVVHEGEIRFGPIYMGQETVFQIPFASVPPPGTYTLAYTFTDLDSQKAVTSESLTISVPEDTTAEEQAPVVINNVTVAPNADPIVFADISADIVLTGVGHRSTRLTLSVHRDGTFLEDFVLAENLSLDPGTTTVTQRYLPGTGWESGTYTFSLKLESTDSGQSSLLLEETDVASLEVP